MEKLRGMVDSYGIGRPSNRKHPDELVGQGMPPRVDVSSTNSGGMWRISVSPPSSKTGGMTMLVTDYQGPLLSVFSCLTDRGRSADMCAPPAVQCSGPVRAALRWTSPPTAGQANAFAGLFHDDAAFEAMPASLTRRLDEEQRSVLRGISSSTKAVHVVDALAGPESRNWRDAL